ncbi:hypothetical protein EMIT0P218_240034 [Pseudomonas sp. IT-P218]|jgi:hypothetical protein
MPTALGLYNITHLSELSVQKRMTNSNLTELLITFKEIFHSESC